MKKLFFLFLAAAQIIGAQTIPPPREATAAETAAGTAHNVFVSPRRVTGAISAGTSVATAAAAASASAAASSASTAATHATSASNSATSASTSAGQAAAIAAGLTYKGTVAGASVSATSTAAGDCYLISSDGTSQSKTWAAGDLAVYRGTSGNWDQMPATVVAGFSDSKVSGRSSRPGLISAGTSAAGTTQDNTGLAFGTGDVSFGVWVRLSDWTPSTTRFLVSKKTVGGAGYVLSIQAAGTVNVSTYNGSATTDVTSTAALGFTDGAWGFVAVTIDRDGNATFYGNGAQVGSAVSVASFSAASQTTTSPLYWGLDNSGGNPLPGTLGETFIVSGLLSASRIADICRAGSIRPFCTATANTTSGQNTLTIDGLSFYQALDFGQGYGPIIRDFSGNNQHALIGTTGHTHAIPRNPPGIPQRAPRTALVFDGTAAAFVRSTLGTQNPGSGDLTLWWDTAKQDVSRSGVFTVGSNSITAYGPGTLSLWRNPSHFAVITYGATFTDSRTLTFVGLETLLAGRRGVYAVTRTSSGIRVYLLVDGDAFDITNLGTESTSGSAPAWTATLTGTYLHAPMVDVGQSNPITIFDLRLANVAMTEAQLRQEYERGEPGSEWRRATNTEALTNGTFETGTAPAATGWSLQASGSSTCANVAGAGVGASNAIQFVVDGSNSPVGIQQGLAIPRGQKCRVTFTAKVDDASGGASLGSDCFGFNQVLTTSFATYTLEATVVADFTNLILKRGNFATGRTFTVDNFSVVPIGYTTRLRTDTAAGLTALNGSKSTTNDSTDFLFSTTGVTTSPDGRVQTIRFSTNTSGNQQLGGASVIDTTKRNRIRSWTIYTTGTPTVSLGNVSAGTQYANGVSLVAGFNDITPTVRVPATANLWCNSSSTATLEHTVILDLEN